MRCSVCEKEVKIVCRGMCKSCYNKWSRQKPGAKEAHAAVEKRRRERLGDEYRRRERLRNVTRSEERKIYNRKYYQSNAEKMREYQREWRRNNPVSRDNVKRKRRAVVKGLEATLTEEQWQEILREHNYSCRYCGERNVKLVREHKTPASRGGGYTKENIVPSCPKCNSSKGPRTEEEFLRTND